MITEEIQHRLVSRYSHRLRVPLHTEDRVFGMLHRLIHPIRRRSRSYKLGCRILNGLMVDGIDSD